MSYFYYDLEDYSNFANEIGFDLKKKENGALYYQGFETGLDENYNEIKFPTESKIEIGELGKIHKVAREWEIESRKEMLQELEYIIKGKKISELPEILVNYINGQRAIIRHLEDKINGKKKENRS